MTVTIAIWGNGVSQLQQRFDLPNAHPHKGRGCEYSQFVAGSHSYLRACGVCVCACARAHEQARVW